MTGVSLSMMDIAVRSRASVGGTTPTPTPAPISQTAIRAVGPGNAGVGLAGASAVSTGTPVVIRQAKVNLSGAPITVANFYHQSWVHVAGAPVNLGNDQPMVSLLEYPSGTPVTDPAAYTVLDGTRHKSADVPTSAPIPNGASFIIQTTINVPAGQRYMLNAGLSGLISTTAAGVARTKVVLFGAGDSLEGNNGGAILNVTNGRCPGIQFAITGTRASQYGANGAANFQKHLDLAQGLGCTHFFADYASNDLQAGDTVATLQSNVTQLRDGARTRGMKAAWATTPPRTNSVVRTASAATATGTNEVTLTVPDASIYVAGDFYGITETPNSFYTRANALCAAVDTVGNTVKFTYPANASRTAPATGAITVNAYLLSGGSGWQTPQFDNTRVPWNAIVRSGYFDSYVEWADNCEPSRDAGRWVNGRDKSPPLLAPFEVTVTSLIGSQPYTRFGINQSMPSNSLNALIWTAGGNIGGFAQSAGSGSTDLTITSAPATAIAIGDKAQLFPSLAYATDDLTHPRDKLGGTSTTYGAQNLLEQPLIAWLTAMLA
jgi:hypothetical protein